MEPIIKLDKICKSFGNKVILNGFSFDVREGETITIVGGSGTGKSIALKMILKLMDPDSGTIFYKGEDIEKMDEGGINKMRSKIGMLFQSGALFDSLTVRENIAYPLREHYDYDENKISEIVNNRLELVGLPGIEDQMPADLSGGMRKRVSLARAIATKPDVILYDEPTTGLDPANTTRINRLIMDLQKKLQATSIVVTHDMESAFTIADRMAFLCDKHVEFVGTVDEARKSDNPKVKNFLEGNFIS